LSKYARRVDSNHGEIRDEFRRLLGAERVVDTSRFGSPLFDLAIAWGGLVMLVETKTRTGKLTDAQEKATLPYKLVRNSADVADAVATLKRWHVQIMGGIL